MTEAAIETRALTKDFGNLRAVDSLDLRVERGEVFGFLGPNGAGKTTTIRMLLDFLRPTSGSAVVLGGSGANPEIRGRIGYLPADLKIDRRYSGRDVFEYFGRLRGMTSLERAADLAAEFELDPSRPSGELSTGNRRKIGIVQAFMHRPELLILDEPTAGLDPLLQAKFIQLVEAAASDGATVFLSSHVLSEVEVLAGRVGVLRNGKLVTVATMDELRASARHRLEFHVEGLAPAGHFDSVPGVAASTVRSGVIEVVVEGSVDAVLKAAAQLTVTRVTTPGDDLADIFMGFYQGDSP